MAKESDVGGSDKKQNGNKPNSDNQRKQWIMNAFAMSSPGHVNAGRLFLKTIFGAENLIDK
jgi:hypothetical protein